MKCAIACLLSCLATASAAAQPASSTRAAAVVENDCAVCHRDDGRGLGPPLAGVLGRKAGTAPGFRYSPAMQGSGIVWTKETLAAFLQNPAKKIPGTRMAYPGIKDAAVARAVANDIAGKR